MKISRVNNTNISHKGLLTNKTLLKGLEFISEHGASFVALTSLAMASGVRPLVISKTPDVEKEKKNYLMANSIVSGLTKFAMVEAIALPIENAVVKNIKGGRSALTEGELRQKCREYAIRIDVKHHIDRI